MTKRKASFPGPYRPWKKLAQASGATLGFIADNVPGAVAGYVAGGDAYDYVSPEKSTPRRRSMPSNAFYKGKIVKPHGIRKNFELQSLSNGYHCTAETYGKIQDSNAVYINHSTHEVALFSECIRGAMLRKGFQKAGVQINERNEELPLFDNQNSDGFKIEYVQINPLNGTFLSKTYITVDNSTLSQVVSLFVDFKTEVDNYLNNVSDYEPFKLNIYSSDRNGVDTNWRVASSINLGNEYVTLISSSEIKLQNRTQGDTAGAADLEIERVDNQPLIARCYLFKNGDPRTRAPNPSVGVALNGAAVSGVRLIKASILSNVTYQNRPHPYYFINCVKSSDTILQPGEMKKSYIMYKFSGKMLQVLKNMKIVSKVTATVNGVRGKCELYCFEEKIRTAGTNPVVVQYERRFKVGCILKSGRGGPLTTSFTSVENNAL